MAEELERIYIIPLRKSGYISSKAAPTAIKRVKHFLTKHMKVEKEKIWIDDSLNKAIWSHGKYKMPSKIRVKAVKFEDGVVEAYLPELEFKKSRRELLREERERKEPILKKEEAEKAEGEAPTEKEYEITPTAEGEVKIKKKKAPKKKKPKEKTSVEKEKKQEKKAPKKKKTSTKKSPKKESKTKTSSKTVSSGKKTDTKKTKKSE